MICRNPSNIPNIQLAREPFAPSTTQNTPSIAETAAMQFCQLNSPLIKKEDKASSMMQAMSTISKVLSVVRLFFTTSEPFFIFISSAKLHIIP